MEKLDIIIFRYRHKEYDNISFNVSFTCPEYSKIDYNTKQHTILNHFKSNNLNKDDFYLRDVDLVINGG